MRASPMHTHTNTHTHVSHVLHGTLFSILHRNCAPFRARGRRPVLSAYFGRLGLNWLFFFFLIHCVFFFQACGILPLPFFFISLFFFASSSPGLFSSYSYCLAFGRASCRCFFSALLSFRSLPRRPARAFASSLLISLRSRFFSFSALSLLCAFLYVAFRN